MTGAATAKSPIIKSQVFKVDAQGYPAELWQTVTP